VRAVLERHYGDASWLQQAQDGAELYAQRIIDQLASSSPPAENAPPILNGQPVRFSQPPRTAQEIKAEMAAEEGTVSRAPGRNLVVNESVPPEEIDARGEVADPMRIRSAPAAPPKSDEWAL
jgi:hypothetical protein